ncbi:serine/threonine protein kinase [Permianibacter sp. IMCC34836]|uniref:protein kinase domain-containing protein n=1 Tax=Permianibacter fluminis TaxID=2738515 RepID=UPI0015544ABB|nr:serine/threonine-protein kinase [Permianibacter fluminis]NQD36572.1 serine/threonine protein kinase [Permianibacter fluminis]
MSKSLDFLVPGGALSGPLFAAFVEQLDGDRPQLKTGDRVGAFVVQRELGRGGASVVYLGERVDGGFGQTVAIKVARASDAHRQRFRFERHLLAQLEHPCIARLIDGGELADGWLWSAMEFVDGVPLDQYCRQQQPSWRQRVQLVRAITEAVRYAHQRLVIHGDLKCSNILVDQQGQPRLLDFGIASHVWQHNESETLAFSPGIASPEQQQGRALTTASDTYQLGLLLATVLGMPAPAKSALSPHNVAAASSVVASGQMPVAVQRNLQAVIARAGQPDVEQRYRSVDELQADLDRVLQHRPVQAQAWSAFDRARFWLQREIRLAFAAAATLLLLGGLTGVYWFHVWAARDVAEREAHSAQVTSQFLSNLFRLTPARTQQALTVEELLDHAAEHGMALLAEREIDQAIAAAALARAYIEQKQHQKAAQLLDRFIDHDTIWSQLTAELQADMLLMRVRAAWHLNEVELAEQRLQQIGQLLRDNTSNSLDAARLRYAGQRATGLSRHNNDQAALRLLQQTVNRWQHEPIADSQEYAELVLLLAYGYDARADAENTLRYAAEAHQRLAAVLGAVAPATLDAQRDWAWYCIKYQQLAAADSVMVQQAALTRQFFGVESIEHALALQMLGNVQYARQDYPAAEQQLRQAVEIFRQRHADEYGFLSMAVQNLADALAMQARWSEVLPLREQVLAIRTPVLPAEHKLLRLSQLRVAEAQCQLGVMAPAQRWRAQAAGMAAELWTSADGSLETAMAGLDRCLRSSPAQ